MLLLFALAGCQPTCEQVCDKLVACEQEGTERMSAKDCEEQCTEQEELYQRWTDTQLREAFDAEKSCLMDSTCEQIFDEGACYDEEVWSF